MQYLFTPAAQRAINAAAAWSSRKGFDELHTPALLMGLLAESECRAAIMLSRHGIDAAAVRRRWPEFGPGEASVEDTSPSSKPLSADLHMSLQTACERSADYLRPLELATEHLLLGLVAADHEVSAWLEEQGLQADALEAEIHRLYGHQPGPLPLEPEKESDDASTSRLSSSEGAHIRETPQTAPFDLHAPSRLQPPQQTRPADLSTADATSLLRLFDAAANRAREGIRTVEDYVRFVLDDRHLTGLCKQLRHDLATLVERISTEHRLAARETRCDVGTGLATPSEFRRDSTASVVAANFTRLQEALRSLEEFAKLLDTALAAELEQLRYRAYTLHRAVEITRTSLQRLDRARLYVLIDGGPSTEELRRLGGSLVEAGVHAIQFRDKSLDDRRLLERARLLRELTRDSDTLLIINDRPDLAVLCRADGVHVGQEELTVKDARTIAGPDALIGMSTHSLDQARQAQLDGANYIGVGPVFASDTKHFDAFPGLDLLRTVAGEIRLPAFAIGGIALENLPEVLSTGFTRVAVSGAIATADDPAAAARELSAALQEVG